MEGPLGVTLFGADGVAAKIVSGTFAIDQLAGVKGQVDVAMRAGTMQEKIQGILEALTGLGFGAFAASRAFSKTETAISFPERPFEKSTDAEVNSLTDTDSLRKADQDYDDPPNLKTVNSVEIPPSVKKGSITWVKETITDVEALNYESGAMGHIPGKAPQFSATDAEGTTKAKFDGIDGDIMVDRKLSITMFSKAQQQALQQSVVAAENGYTVRWRCQTDPKKIGR